jgi:outer membrane protein assembly factor BamB
MRRSYLLLTALAFTSVAQAVPPPLPQPATSFGASIADGWLYVYGGNTGKAHEFNKECVKGDFFRAKLPDGTEWEKLTGGTPLLSPSLVTYKGKVIRIGGMNARNEKGAKSDLYSTDEVMAYDPSTQQWEALPSLPEPRSSHDSVVVGDTLYLGGGWKLAGDDGDGVHSTWTKSTLALDLSHPEKGWTAQPQAFERRAIATVAQGDKIWFLGGMDSDDKPSRAVDWWEPKTNTWGKGPELPDGAMGGFGIAGCAADGKVLASPLSGIVSALSTDGTKWEPIAKLEPARFFHRLLPFNEKELVAVGGSNRKGHVREVEILALDGKSLTKPEAAPAPETKPAAEAKAPTEPKTSMTWPQWRGPNRDGISTETGWNKTWPAEGPKKLWTVLVGTGMSSAVAADGRLFTQGSDGESNESVVALDAATGAELWKFTFPCKAVAHEMPIVPNGPCATPTVHGGFVYILSREGDLIALETSNGNVVWRKNLVTDLKGKRPVYGFAQSPLVEDGRVFLDVGAAAGETGSTVALDAATGGLVWRAGTGEAGYSAARLLTRDGKRYIAMFKGEALHVFDPADGKVAWSFKTTARDYANAATPVFVGHRILVSNTSADESAALLDWETGETPNVRPIWKHKQFAQLFNSAIPLEGCLFAFNEKRRGHNEFTCVDATTGESRWVSDAIPTSTFILADGHFIFLTREGEVILAPASTAEATKPTARFKALENKCYATPTLAGGRLFVRDNTGVLAAFDLRGN